MFIKLVDCIGNTFIHLFKVIYDLSTYIVEWNRKNDKTSLLENWKYLTLSCYSIEKYLTGVIFASLQTSELSMDCPQLKESCAL